MAHIVNYVRSTSRLSRLLGTTFMLAALVGAMLVAPLGASASNDEVEPDASSETSSNARIFFSGTADVATEAPGNQQDAEDGIRDRSEDHRERTSDDDPSEDELSGENGEDDTSDSEMPGNEDIDDSTDNDVPTEDESDDAFAIDVEEILAFVASGQSLGDYAELYGISPDMLVDSILSEIEVQIDAAVDLGLLTQEQADELLATAEEHLGALIAGDIEDGENDDSDAPDPDGDTDDNGTDTGNLNEETFGALDTIAELTGTSVEDVTAAVMEGNTLVAFAEEHGVSGDELVAAIIVDVEAQIAADVESGQLTQEQADQILAHLGEIVTTIVNTPDLGEIIDDLENCDPLEPMDGATSDNRSFDPALVCPAG